MIMMMRGMWSTAHNLDYRISYLIFHSMKTPYSSSKCHHFVAAFMLQLLDRKWTGREGISITSSALQLGVSHPPPSQALLEATSGLAGR